jgi:hypothetical protein
MTVKLGEFNLQGNSLVSLTTGIRGSRFMHDDKSVTGLFTNYRAALPGFWRKMIIDFFLKEVHCAAITTGFLVGQGPASSASVPRAAAPNL